jgi:hypothetical protein
MLRAALILLLLANAGLWAWGQGWWPGAVPPDRVGREPQRLALQIQPEALRVLSPAQAEALSRRLSLPAGAAPACLEAGPFTAGAVGAAEAVLLAQGLRPDEWARLPAADDAADTGLRLRVASADAALQARLLALAHPALGTGFRACDNGAR